MEWAPVVEVGNNLGKQNGRLVISGRKVEWWRYGYVFRQYTMEHRIHYAEFVQYANSSDARELWVVIVSEDRLVHSFGTQSGRYHVIGLNSIPRSLVPCSKQGIVFTCIEQDHKHLSMHILQGPEELIKNMVPSSVSAPLRVDDELLFCDDSTVIVWNEHSHSVRAYAVRILQHVRQANNLTSLDGLHKAAVFSPLREWSQASIGKIFSQRLENLKPGDKPLSLVATHDPSSRFLYVLCGPDLVRHEGIRFVAPIAGVHRFPGAVTVSENDASNDSGHEMTYSCLFFPNIAPLLIPLAKKLGAIEKLVSEQSSNRVGVEFQNAKSVRIAISDSMDEITRTIFDILLEIFGPAETATWLFVFLAKKSQPPTTNIDAFFKTVLELIDSVDSTLISRLFIYLHMLREELSLSATNDGIIEDLGKLISPFVSDWGSSWSALYGAEHGEDSSAENSLLESLPKIPCIMESPPSVLAGLSYCMNSNMGSPLPELANNSRYFPNTVLLISIFQLISTCSSPDEVKYFLELNAVCEKIDVFCPGVRACLLEILGYVGMNPYADTATTPMQLSPQNTAMEEMENGLQDKGHRVSRSISEWSSKIEKLTRGRFAHDLRYKEALQLLQTKTPQRCLFGIYFNAEAIAEHRFAKIQKEWGEALASRALATAFGMAAIEMNSRKPHLWEQLEAPAIEFSGECTETGIMIPPVYKSLAKAAEHDPWGVFACGASLGLSISPQSPGINSLWVITSAQLNSVSTDLYAGFVYGMGLSSHLANLEDWQFYESLVSSNTRGTLAALLGVAASKRGSRDAKLTKVISVHIRALLPVEAHDTQLVPPEVERAALVSLGLLYMGHGVRHLTEALWRELTWSPSEDKLINGENSEDNEARKLAVGIALGLINCGLGKSSGLDQLLSSITGFHDRSVYSAEIVNGALCAILLSFIGTNDEIVASQIQIPRTRAAAEYSSPNMFFGRTLVYHLIMWDEVGVSKEWVNKYVLFELKTQPDESAATKLDGLWYYYSLCGTLVAMAMRHVASNDESVIETLLSFIENEFYRTYVECLTELAKYSKPVEATALPENDSKDIDYDLAQMGKHLAQLLNALALALGAVSAGSGSLPVLRMLRKLWQISPQVQASVAEHAGTVCSEDIGLDLTCVSQAIGWLFMCGGQCSFNTDHNSVAFLTVFTYLNMLGGSNISSKEWQHLRFFWSLTTEPRCLYAQHDPSENISIEISLISGEVIRTHLPTMLPALNEVSSVRVDDPKYAPVEVNRDVLLDTLRNGLHVTAREIGRDTLESMLPSSHPIVNWDRLPVRSLRANLQAMARNPSSKQDLADLTFLLCFSEMWPAENDARLLKRQDIEQLKFLQWYSQSS